MNVHLLGDELLAKLGPVTETVERNVLMRLSHTCSCKTTIDRVLSVTDRLIDAEHDHAHGCCLRSVDTSLESRHQRQNDNHPMKVKPRSKNTFGGVSKCMLSMSPSVKKLLHVSIHT